jgi:hypothetical protein
MTRDPVPFRVPGIRPIRDTDWPVIDRLQRICFPPTAVEAPEVSQSLSRHSPESRLLAETDTSLA